MQHERGQQDARDVSARIHELGHLGAMRVAMKERLQSPSASSRTSSSRASRSPTATRWWSKAASIDVAEIHGRFDGELTARKQLVIHATGKVSGKIRYGNIKIDEGGEISGDIASLGAAGAPKK